MAAAAAKWMNKFGKDDGLRKDPPKKFSRTVKFPPEQLDKQKTTAARTEVTSEKVVLGGKDAASVKGEVTSGKVRGQGKVSVGRGDGSLADKVKSKTARHSGLAPRGVPNGAAKDEHAPKIDATKHVTKMSDLDPSLVGHITMHLPPPPGTQERLQSHINAQNQQAYVPTIGNTKAALDTLRGDLMNFYSRLYSRPTSSFEDRLARLRDNNWPTAMDGAAGMRYDDSDSESDLRGDEVNFASEHLLQRKHGASYKRHRNKEEGVLGVISDISKEVANVESRMEKAGSWLQDNTEDPTKRSWVHNKDYPRSKRHPSVPGQIKGVDFEEHCDTLYTHLKVRSSRNDERIKALQNRLRVMKLQLNNEADNRSGL